MPLYAFSNSNAAHAHVWRRRFAPALAVFDRHVVSCELGARQPERAAFEAIARAIGVPPEPIVFFDDTRENADGARAPRDCKRCRCNRRRDLRAALRPLLDAT